MKRVLVSNPVGNLGSFEAAIALHETGCLSAFHTCLFRPFGSRYRGHPELVNAPIVKHPWREMLRVACCRLPGGESIGRSVAARDWVTSAFDRTVANHVGDGEQAVYAFEDFAQATFTAAKRKGRETIYDLPTVYFEEARAIAAREIENDPSLAPLLQSAREPEHRICRKRTEMEMADHVICASSFVARSVGKHIGSAAPKTSVVPLGADVSAKPKRWAESADRRPVNLLFLGSISPHKGIHHLFAALEGIDPREFRLKLAGRWMPGFEEWLTRRYRITYDYAGHVDRERVYGLCRESEVLVFPALQDGFGLVLTEAMAAGIPVAASRNSGAPDFVEDGVDGFLFDAGDPQVVHAAMCRILDARQRLAEMGHRARVKAERLSWTRYRHAILAAFGVQAQ